MARGTSRIVETIFAYPGLGRLLIYAIEHRDIPLLQAGMLLVAAVVSGSTSLLVKGIVATAALVGFYRVAISHMLTGDDRLLVLEGLRGLRGGQQS